MDLIRVLAMFLVIIVHTKSMFFTMNTYPHIYMFLKVIGTVGVPLFVILTGYLMFDRDYENDNYLKKFLLGNLLPLVVAYEFWNIAWNVFRYAPFTENPQKWSAIAKAALFMGDTVSALWYLPMTIALYLGMPILSVFCHRITSKLYAKILIFALIMSGTLIPSVAPILSFTGHTPSIHSVLRMNIFGASVWGESVWMIYLLAGWAISHGKLKQIKTSMLSVCGIILPFALMYGAELFKHSVQHYDFVLVVILSISVFELLTRTDTNLISHKNFRKIITSVSRFSFAVYMLHSFIGKAIRKTLSLIVTTPPPENPLAPAISVLSYIAFLISIVAIIYVIVEIVKRNYFFRRYVLLMK